MLASWGSSSGYSSLGRAALLSLPDGGIAAGTERGQVDLFNVSAVQHGGAAYAHLLASGEISALLSLPDGGIAAGTGDGALAGQVDLFNASQLSMVLVGQLTLSCLPVMRSLHF